MKALCGCDYVRDIDGLPENRNEGGWISWANREAKRKSKIDRFDWTAVVAWIQFRNAFRISFAGQPERGY